MQTATVIEVTRTYLEMRDPAELQGAELADPRIQIEEQRDCSIDLFRFLYAEVGKNYHWIERLPWTDEQIVAHVSRDARSCRIAGRGARRSAHSNRGATRLLNRLVPLSLCRSWQELSLDRAAAVDGRADRRARISRCAILPNCRARSSPIRAFKSRSNATAQSTCSAFSMPKLARTITGSSGCRGRTSRSSRTYLEMRDPAELQGAELADPRIQIEEQRDCSIDLYRFLYAEVGKNYHWIERLPWTDEQIVAHVSRDARSCRIAGRGARRSAHSNRGATRLLNRLVPLSL